MARHDYIAQDVATKGNNKKESGRPRIIKNSWKFNNKNKRECYREGINNNKTDR